MIELEERLSRIEIVQAAYFREAHKCYENYLKTLGEDQGYDTDGYNAFLVELAPHLKEACAQIAQIRGAHDRRTD